MSPYWKEKLQKAGIKEEEVRDEIFLIEKFGMGAFIEEKLIREGRLNETSTEAENSSEDNIHNAKFDNYFHLDLIYDF